MRKRRYCETVRVYVYVIRIRARVATVCMCVVVASRPYKTKQFFFHTTVYGLYIIIFFLNLYAIYEIRSADVELCFVDTRVQKKKKKLNRQQICQNTQRLSKANARTM